MIFIWSAIQAENPGAENPGAQNQVTKGKEMKAGQIDQLVDHKESQKKMSNMTLSNCNLQVAVWTIQHQRKSLQKWRTKQIRIGNSFAEMLQQICQQHSFWLMMVWQCCQAHQSGFMFSVAWHAKTWQMDNDTCSQDSEHAFSEDKIDRLFSLALALWRKVSKMHSCSAHCWQQESLKSTAVSNSCEAMLSSGNCQRRPICKFNWRKKQCGHGNHRRNKNCSQSLFDSTDAMTCTDHAHVLSLSFNCVSLCMEMRVDFENVNCFFAVAQIVRESGNRQIHKLITSLLFASTWRLWHEDQSSQHFDSKPIPHFCCFCVVFSVCWHFLVAKAQRRHGCTTEWPDGSC